MILEDAYELSNYLPRSFKTPAEQEYIAFLWDSFDTNLQSDKLQFAFLAYHMLTMCFVYFNIWKIKLNRPNDFQMATFGFTKNNEDIILSATSPFAFSQISESAIFRFLKLLNCDNVKIGTYTKLVKDRNDSAHPNGLIQFLNPSSLEKKISDTLRIVTEIQSFSQPVIDGCYRQFLLNSSDTDNREYSDDSDQIREALIHTNYFSQKDIGICIECDISEFFSHPKSGAIQSLHSIVREQSTE
jgi:hypothetical protein